MAAKMLLTARRHQLGLVAERRRRWLAVSADAFLQRGRLLRDHREGDDVRHDTA